MDSFRPNSFDIVDIYAKYCEIVSCIGGSGAKLSLSLLSKSMDERRKSRDAITGDIQKLIAFVDLSDPEQFNCFYDFVFFICRENGQKNISVNRAVSAWRTILHGRFRLLDQWCNFIQNHQKHNISEDTWQQLLAFSKCVDEDLDEYDPSGAWPVVIDDFVEHMYRVDDSLHRGSISRTFSELTFGSKRKIPLEDPVSQEAAEMMHLKRQKVYKLVQHLTLEVNRRNINDGFVKKPSVCAVEDGLSKGFEGCLSIGSALKFNEKYRAL